MNGIYVATDEEGYRRVKENGIISRPAKEKKNRRNERKKKKVHPMARDAFPDVQVLSV